MLRVFRSNHHCSWKFYKLHRKTPVLESLCKNWLQELISNLLNLQTTYPIAKNKSYQNFTTDIVKLKRKQFVTANTLIQWRSSLLINTLPYLQKPMTRLPLQYFKVTPGKYVVAIRHVISHRGWQTSFQMFTYFRQL